MLWTKYRLAEKYVADVLLEYTHSCHAAANKLISVMNAYPESLNITVIRMDIRSSSNVLEHIMLDESAEPTNLPLALLQHITENFADERQVGRGGFGVVYKVNLGSHSEL
jgi:hypothetical protein